MSNHLTPSELARATGLDRQDVIAKCVEMGVPIFEGKIDKTLFRECLHESGTMDTAAASAPTAAVSTPAST